MRSISRRCRVRERFVVNRSVVLCAIALLAVGLLSGRLQAASSASTTPASVQERLGVLRKRVSQFKDLLGTIYGDRSYPLVTLTVLQNFCDLVEQDLRERVPDGWGWVCLNGNDSGFTMEGDGPHSTLWSIRITNRTPQQPNVYGMMENSHGVSLKVGGRYTLSAWVRATDAGTTSFILSGDWNSRLSIPKSTGGRWERISRTFTAGAGDVAFTPRIVCESPTPGVWVDDVWLVEGEQAEVGNNLIFNSGFDLLYTQRRAERMLGELEPMADRLGRELKEAAAGTRTFSEVPRWSGGRRPRIVGPSFVGPLKWSSKPGEASERPIFFVGYGHFDQVRKDVEKFPSYGVNIIQSAEFGPGAIYPTPQTTDDTMIRQTLEMLDRAARAGVAVDLLISPHYFPDWMMEKYPQMRKRRADFFPYSVYSPQAQELLKKFIAHTLAPLKDHPALLSICLSNEPINIEEPGDDSRAAWHAWLARKHGDVSHLNRRWGSNYGSFDQVPQPNPFGPAPGEKRPSPMWQDYVRFNQEWFAAFHKMLADAVHEVAPRLPVHAKATTWTLYRPDLVAGGNDPTLLGAVTDINGNDSVNLWGFGERAGLSLERGDRDFAQGWRENALAYDLQRSVHDAPVFNSENHLIMDRETRDVSPAHVRAALWQEAVHGQSATTIWVWERDANPRSDFAGDIMERPLCAEAVGLVSHDLNRATPQITALQKAPADVLILQSGTAATWDGSRYGDALLKAYTALSYTGLKVGFVTERQLERGEAREEKLILVPEITHLSDAAYDGLARLKNRIVYIGKGPLAKNEYDAGRGGSLRGERVEVEAGKTTWQQLWKALLPQLAAAKLSPAVRVEGFASAPQDRVQWQCATTGEGTVVNLYNGSHDPASVVLLRQGSARGYFREVLTGERVEAREKVTLEPLAVRIYEWKDGEGQ